MEILIVKTSFKALTATWIVTFLSLFSLNAQADRPSYNFISLEHVNRNIDNIIVDPFSMGINEEDFSFDGFSLTGSIEINDKWFAELRYLDIEGDQVTRTGFTAPASSFSPTPSGAVTGTQQSKFDTEARLTTTSIGYQVHQDENSSTFIAVGFASVDVEFTEHSEFIFRDATGNIVPPAPWTPFTQTVSGSDSGAIVSAGYRVNLGRQIQLGIRVDNMFIDDSEISFAGELLYKFAKTFALQISSEITDEETQFGAGFRFIF